MKQLLLVLFLTLTPAAYLTAATVKGWVKDAQTGEELIGAAVYVKENPAMGTTAGLDGIIRYAPNIRISTPRM